MHYYVFCICREFSNSHQYSFLSCFIYSFIYYNLRPHDPLKHSRGDLWAGWARFAEREFEGAHSKFSAQGPQFLAAALLVKVRKCIMLVQCTGLRNTGLISVPEHSMFTPFFVSRLEQRNKVLQGEVAGLRSTLEQQRRWVSVADIKMRNVERARADADRRNTTLQQEMEQFFETFGELNGEARKTSRIVQSF